MILFYKAASANDRASGARARFACELKLVGSGGGGGGCGCGCDIRSARGVREQAQVRAAYANAALT